MLETLREISVVPSSQTLQIQTEGNNKEEVRDGEEKEDGKNSVAGTTAKSEVPSVDAWESSASLVSSVSVLTRSSGENGGETEEDEGMILVGRPT